MALIFNSYAILLIMGQLHYNNISFSYFLRQENFCYLNFHIAELFIFDSKEQPGDNSIAF
jgi:hypothetical protein